MASLKASSPNQTVHHRTPTSTLMNRRPLFLKPHQLTNRQLAFLANSLHHAIPKKKEEENSGKNTYRKKTGIYRESEAIGLKGFPIAPQQPYL